MYVSKAKITAVCQQAAEVSLCLVIFSIPISIAMTNSAIGFSIFFWLIKKIVNKDVSLAMSSINIFLFLLLLGSLVSMVNSTRISSSIGGIGKIAKYLILFFVLTETLNDGRSIKRVIWAAFFGLGLASIDGIVQIVRGKDFIRGYPLFTHIWSQYGGLTTKRVQASMHNPNDFACYLITIIPIIISVTLYYLKGKSKMLAAIVGLMALFCMVNTHYRGAALGFLVMIILFSILKRDARLFIALIILVLLLPLVLPKPPLMWLINNPNPYDFFIEEGGRRGHWHTAINMIKAHPFLGIGTNTFSISYEKYRPLGNLYQNWYAHNSYLQMAAEIGLFSFGTFAAMLFVLINNWRKSFKKIKQIEFRAISLGVMGGFLGFLIAAIFESSLQYSNLAVLFWFMVGLLVCVNKTLKEPA